MRIDLALHTVTASASTRTITGTACLYDVNASASTGPVRFAAGSLSWSDDLARVKLLIDHDQSQPVGYLTAATDSATSLVCTFAVPAGDAGDQALTQAANGLRDGLSVGAFCEDDGYTFDDSGRLLVSAAVVREVSLCALPAIDDARVSDVAATQKVGSAMPTPAAPVVAPAPAPVPAPAPGAVAAPVTVATSAAPIHVAPAIVVAERGSVMTLRAAATLISNMVRAGGGASEIRAGLGVQAALADVLVSDDAGHGFTPPVWLGELWMASTARRPFIDALGTPRPLTGIKVYGWQWDILPQVVDYAGDKTLIVGNDVGTKPAEATATRTAGGWDIDRIYVDLGEPGMIEALFAAATDDYRRKSEVKVAAALLAGATAVTGVNTLPQALTALGWAAASLGAQVGAVGFGADVWAGFTELTRDQVPWWMGSGDSINLGTTEGTVGGMKLFASSNLAATEVLAADPNAATFFEVGTPIRVQAVDVAKGGIDLGVFGYQALIINDARAILKTTVVPVVVP